MKQLDITGYKPSAELLVALIKSDELAIMNLSGVNEDWARQAIANLHDEIARFHAELERQSA
jgi:uncharacterized small protein (DUF1192 family)